MIQWFKNKLFERRCKMLFPTFREDNEEFLGIEEAKMNAEKLRENKEDFGFTYEDMFRHMHGSNTYANPFSSNHQYYGGLWYTYLGNLF